MRSLAAAILSAVLSCTAAMAAEPVFPPASRIGLVPPADMVPSRRFTGFENGEKAAAIMLTEMPPEAYEQMGAGFTREALRRQGLDMTSREEVQLGSRTGLLISGAMTRPVEGRKWLLAVKDSGMTAFIVAYVQGGSDGYSEEQMREALKSVALRDPVSLDEQISALPFRVGDRAGFRPVKVLAGNSLLFTEGPADVVKAAEQPIAILAASLNAPPPPRGSGATSSPSWRSDPPRPSRTSASSARRVFASGARTGTRSSPGRPMRNPASRSWSCRRSGLSPTATCAWSA